VHLVKLLASAAEALQDCWQKQCLKQHSMMMKSKMAVFSSFLAITSRYL